MPLNPQLDTLSDYPFEALRTLLNPVTPVVNDPPILMSLGEPQHQPPALLGRDAGGACARVEQVSADGRHAGVAPGDRRLADPALPAARRRARSRPAHRQPGRHQGGALPVLQPGRAAPQGRAAGRSCWCRTRITSSTTARRRWPGPTRCFSTRPATTTSCPTSRRSRARPWNAPRCSTCARRPTRRARSPASTI